MDDDRQETEHLVTQTPPNASSTLEAAAAHQDELEPLIEEVRTLRVRQAQLAAQAARSASASRALRSERDGLDVRLDEVFAEIGARVFDALAPRLECSAPTTPGEVVRDPTSARAKVREHGISKNIEVSEDIEVGEDTTPPHAESADNSSTDVLEEVP